MVPIHSMYASRSGLTYTPTTPSITCDPYWFNPSSNYIPRSSSTPPLSLLKQRLKELNKEAIKYPRRSDLKLQARNLVLEIKKLERKK